MIVPFPKPSNYKINEKDLVAIKKDESFIGYGEVLCVLESKVLVSVDKNTGKVFNALYGNDIPHELTLE